MSEIPKLAVLKAITPVEDGGRLTYNNLEASATKHSPWQTERERQFWDSEPDSLDEMSKARQTALAYLIMTAQKQNRDFADDSSRDLWAERFTRASEELYGSPDTAEAIRLLCMQLESIEQCLKDKACTVIDREKLELYLNTTKELLGDSELSAENVETENIKDALSIYLREEFRDSFTVFSEEDSSSEYGPIEIVEIFSRAINRLSLTEPVFLEWRVEIAEGKDMLSVSGSSKKINVGENRRDASLSELEGLFAHEVLVHALRCVNGSKIDEKLGSGLPGYLDLEEGLGTLAEYAVTGKLPEKNIDRYVDIAFALGKLDGQPKTRKEVLDYARSRECARLISKGESLTEKALEQIESKIKTHVNRIFRGTTGDEHGGIFTKDIVYHKGFSTVYKFVKEKIEQGIPPQEIFRYLLLGKFDPTNQLHIEYLKRLNETYTI